MSLPVLGSVTVIARPTVRRITLASTTSGVLRCSARDRNVIYVHILMKRQLQIGRLGRMSSSNMSRADRDVKCCMGRFCVGIFGILGT